MIFDPSLNERDCGRSENAELLQLDQLVEAEALQPVIRVRAAAKLFEMRVSGLGVSSNAF